MASSSASSEATFTGGTPPEADSAAVVTVEEKKRDIEVAHKTKVIQFLGRTTPIILQNDNGPCPLLAICNVLLLKNQLNVSPDIPEISQEKLLYLVAERLLDSNSNINNKDAGYAENQQQNIADAIDLLHRLATGIDVNIKFTRIDDFEFTRECAIFDLLDIPLYHGWIVDPQDYDTATVIGSKSYNTLVEELVALDARDTETESKEKSEEECVDFAAATTATLGVPSPCFSRGRSFDDSPVIDPGSPKTRKGDITEESELQRVLNLSVSEVSTLIDPGSPKTRKGDITEESELQRVLNLSVSEVSTSSKYNAVSESEPVSLVETLEQNGGSESQNHCFRESSISDNSIDLLDHNIERKGAEIISQVGVSSSGGIEQGPPLVQTSSGEPADHVIVPETSVDALVNKASVSHESGLSAGEDDRHTAENYEDNQKQVAPTSEIVSSENIPFQCETPENSNLLVTASDTDSSITKSPSRCETEGIVPSVVESEPIYEGEESIIESETIINQSREPMYEGEVILAEQCVTGFKEVCDDKKEEITSKEGALIRNFLRNSASQLTIYGLFRLRDDLKERELCVFFRNNHFNTMFKFEGDLYILATDQGFMNQPGLVWEKLNEVNGDTVYMTCDFKEFNGEDHNNTAWDEQIARASTAEFLANSAEDENYDADMKLARDLQQQEFDQYPPPPQEQNPPQHQSATGGSRLIVGPQVSSRSSGSRPVAHSSKQETKSAKDKCTIM